MQSWKYFIFLMLCKLVIGARSSIVQENTAKAALGDIEAFVYDSYGSLDPNLTTIFTPGQKIKISGRLNIGGIGGEVKSIDVEHLPTHYTEINRNMMECLIRCIPRTLKFYVCFDELDIGFDPKRQDYIQRVVGLFRAAKYINERFAQESIKAAAIILLRDDIWHTLRFEDKNKIAQSQLSEIKWSQEEGPHCLKHLMERRFATVIGGGKPVPWGWLFDETQSIGQFQSKYDYICRRGFLRPRDIILYCNETLNCFKKTESEWIFDNNAVKAAERPYSNYFLQELQDELHKHSLAYERYFEVLKGLLNVTFSQEEFEQAWQENRTLFDNDDTPASALEALFDFSVIGFLASGGQRAGSKYVWRYEDPRARFKAAKNYQVHLGLKEEFELKLYARRKTKA